MTGTCRIERMGRRLRFLLGVIAALAAALPIASAAEEEMTWYAIEIIVFERASEIGRNAEAWPSEPGLPSLADAIELSREGLTPEELTGDAPSEAPTEVTVETDVVPIAPTPPIPPIPSTPMPRAFQLVPEEEYRLTDAWERLNKSSAYRPLLHIGWIQPGYPSEEARLVHVRNSNATLGTVDSSVEEGVAEGVTEGVEEGVEKSVDEDAATPSFGNEEGFAPTLSPRITFARDPSKVALDGTLRVHRARYLHVEADLLYYRPLDGDTSVAPASGDAPDAAPMLDSPDTALIEHLLAEDDVAPRLFRLTESRRMRSRELHYLDHPLFGMLVEVWPVELPEMPAEAVLPVEGDAPQPAAPAQSGSGG